MSKIKVLQIHKFFRQEGMGGSIAAMFGLIDLLEKNGHKVMVFSSKNKLNRKTKYEKYFVNSLNLSQKDNPGLFRKTLLGFKTIYSREAYKKLDYLIKKEGKPDIAHLHLFTYHLTPAIISVLKRHGIPVIQTLHDYQLICPNYKLLTKGAICEQCKQKKYYQCAINQCIQGSYARSFLGALERYVNRWLKDYVKDIDLFIAPSNFLKQKAIEFGIDQNKITVAPNYIPFKKVFGDKPFRESNSKTKYALYFGRLSPEKGVHTLIKAMKLIKDKSLKLKIAGTGPEERVLQAIVEKNGLENRVDFKGFVNRKDLSPLIKGALFTVYPSEWYENSPLSIYESLYFNTPVIGSKIGGIPELIKSDFNGYLFRVGSSKDLAGKIDLFSSAKAAALSKNCRQSIEKLMDYENYYNNLINIYKKLL